MAVFPLVLLGSSAFNGFSAVRGRRAFSTLCAVTGLCSLLIGAFVLELQETNDGPVTVVEANPLPRWKDELPFGEWVDTEVSQHAELKADIRDQLLRAGITDESVDAYPYQAGNIAFAALNYHPRPTFQNFAANNARIQRANLDHLRNDPPEPLLIYPIKDLDGVLETLRIGPSLIEIMESDRPSGRIYTKPMTTDEAMVWTRRDLRFDSELSYGEAVEAKVGEWVELAPNGRAPGFLPALSIDAHSRVLPRLITTLLKPPPIHIELRYDNGSVSRRNFSKLTARTGFVLPIGSKPLLHEFAKKERHFVTHFRIVENETYPSTLKPNTPTASGNFERLQR